MALIVLDSKDGASDFVVRGWIRATAQREHLHRETASVEEGSTSNPRGLALSLVSLSLRALTRSAYRRLGKPAQWRRDPSDRKSTRLNSSHLGISYAVFCLKKKNIKK